METNLKTQAETKSGEVYSYVVTQSQYDSVLDYVRNPSGVQEGQVIFEFSAVMVDGSDQYWDVDTLITVVNRSGKPVAYHTVKDDNGDEIERRDFEDGFASELLESALYGEVVTFPDGLEMVADLSQVDRRNRMQIVLDVNYEMSSLIEAGNSSELMASSVVEQLKDAIGNGLLTSFSPEVETDDYSIHVSTRFDNEDDVGS